METERPLHNSLHSMSSVPVHTDDSRVAPKETRVPMRMEKITRIRNKIFQGSYDVTATDVAKAILRRTALQLGLKRKEE